VITPLLVLLATGLQAETPDPERIGPAPVTPRAIVFVNRSKEVPGHLEYEDPHVVIVERLDGVAECFHKDTVLGIARLVELDAPREGVVIMRDDSRQRGLIVQDGFERVELLINGVPLVIPRERVSHVLLEAPLDQQYLQYRLSIDSSDLESHLGLCRWLIQRNAYDLAIKELNQIVSTHRDPEAARMLRMVEAQVLLQQQHDDNPPPAPEPKPQRIPDRLTDREVNLIRVYEIDLENPPRVLVPRNAVMELCEHYGTSSLVPDTETEQLALAASPSIDIVRLLFKLRARELYDRIQVLSEPMALQLFRERVHDTWLMNNCSTTRCHGGTGAGRFSLQRARSTDDRTRYTNLLMIDRFRCDDGASLVDWDDPPSSRLIQYGLPADQTNTPHPDVPGWKPVFGGSQRALAKGAELWIGSMRSTPRPVYPVGEWLIPAPPPEPASPADAVEPPDADEAPTP
tara:strand:+ start:9713 stop:11089 length:1377 start_codon:yes stop_codon:yes gene_type:complete